VEAFGTLIVDPVLDRPEVVPKGDFARRLDARQNTGHRTDHVTGAVGRGYAWFVPYAVTTPVFEGPFDLLLHLITREQVDLYEISLSAIVDAYLVELEKMEDLDLDIATEFLLIAATLIELKLRRLLPDREGIDLDEELALLEERDLLLAKLLEYRTFKEAAKAMDRRMAEAAKSLPRPGGLEDAFAELTPDVLSGLSPERLRAVFLTAVRRFLTPKPEPKVTLDHVTQVRVTVAETVAELASTLPARGRVSFRDLTEDLESRMEVIVHFLAVLELCKQGWVDLDQSRNFGDLLVSWRPGGPQQDEIDDVVDDMLDDAHRAGRLDAGKPVPVTVVLEEVDSYEG
jgi:segregation and condensation protein A